VYENKQKAKRPSELAAAEIQKALINKFLTKQTASTEKATQNPEPNPRALRKDMVANVLARSRSHKPYNNYQFKRHYTNY